MKAVSAISIFCLLGYSLWAGFTANEFHEEIPSEGIQENLQTLEESPQQPLPVTNGWLPPDVVKKIEEHDGQTEYYKHITNNLIDN